MSLRMERVNFLCMRKVIAAAKKLDEIEQLETPGKEDEDGYQLFSSILIVEHWLNRHKDIEDDC